MPRTDKWKAPSNFREFIQELSSTWRTVKYAFALTDSKDARPWLYKKYAFSMILVMIGMVQPKLIAIIFQGVIDKSEKVILYGVLAVVGMMVFREFWAFLYWRAHEHLFGRSMRNLNIRIAESFFDKSPGQHRHTRTLNYESIQKGRNRTWDIYTGQIPELAEVVANILIAYALIWTVSSYGGIVLGTVIVLYLIWSVYLNYLVAVVCTPIERDFSKYERYFAETFRLFERVYSSNKKDFELERVSDRWWEIALRDRIFWVGHIKRVTVSDAVMVIALGLIFYHEAMRTMTNNVISLALLYPLFSWSTQIFSNLWRIRHIERRIYESVPAVEVMRETLAIEPEIRETPVAKELPTGGPITLGFENVTYSYPASEETLSGITFDVKPGEKVALVGPTGAGKSTIEYMVLRFMDPASGRVLVNGEDLRNFKISSVLDAIGYIPQKPLIFDGTVRENLLYGLPANERDLWCDEKLLELMTDLAIDFGVRPADENPLDIVVGRDGIQLSGGQAQRLTIGAATIKRPRLLVVDEATSALDSATETQVLEGLRKWINGAGMLVIAHRLSTVKDADKIVVVNNGRVEKMGDSFSKLARESSTFGRLISGQDHLLA